LDGSVFSGACIPLTLPQDIRTSSTPAIYTMTAMDASAPPHAAAAPPPGAPLVAVVGSTSTGKSDLAIALAQRLDGEIVNADALQLYRGMDIGTAKVTVQDRKSVVQGTRAG